MKIIRVQYTVKEDYVDTNKANIRQVMEDLRQLDNENVRYASYLGEDGRTFTHMVMYRDEETTNPMSALPSFQSFQEQLKASNPERPPESERLDFVGAGFDIFT